MSQLLLENFNNVFVKDHSTAEFSINAVASKHATIVSQSIRCGSKVISNLDSGLLDNTESGTFIFSATDSRGLTVEQVIERDFVDYVALTCNQEAKIEVGEETDAIITLTISGNYFNDTFGAFPNELALEVWKILQKSKQNHGKECGTTAKFLRTSAK